MALTSGDKAECKEIAREIVKEVLAEHTILCPHGLWIMKSRAWFVGIGLGIGLGGGLGGGGLACLVAHAFGALGS